jgi:hypothetical protein
MDNNEDRWTGIKYELKSTKEKEVEVYIETGTEKPIKSRNQYRRSGPTMSLTQVTRVFLSRDMSIYK